MKLHSAIFYSNNIDIARDFHLNVTGLTVEYQSGDKFVSLLFENGIRLGIKRATEDREIPGSQTVFIEVTNIDQLYAQMKQKGVTIRKELTDESWAKNFSILDPDNNKVQFVEVKTN